ncbi:heavy metal translocating P-type ATPase [Sediminibacterium ginsengisoli]|uniref:Cu2+-exporting ATPase n=1 Tax=Sediminibacterium ginsengisoli TaxID=413434 RepID=A0A1T4MDL5_9BACT|nr:heavy metal translocating P-type ATPase [Sediminibacterium ginsengisoli]SJZ64947.1 Cu2+-exporting ATPase [Sediminibacterium ginsengisoli]
MQKNSGQTVFLPVEGMESEHCALIISKGLDQVPGISAHTEELNNTRVILHGQDPATITRNAAEKINSLGYRVPQVTKTFPLLHMTCASCAASATSILEQVPGVLEVSVNYAGAQARISFVPGLTGPAQLKQALQSIGYDLVIEEGDTTDLLEELKQVRHKQLRRRTLIAIALSIPLFIIAMFFMDMPYADYIMWALSTPVVFLCGQPFFTGAWKQLRHFSANMDTLVALSTGVAYLFSVFNTLMPGYWHSRGLHAHVYFESAAIVITFVLLGKMLEEKARANTSFALKKLAGLQPSTVMVVDENGQPHETAIAAVQINDLIQVKPGEKIAVDGTLTEGSSFVDESMISGEPVPAEKMPGSKVFAGTINQKGSFRFRADKVGGETLLARIIAQVREAQGSKAPVQQLVDKIAGVFVPVVIVISLVAFGTWFIWGGTNGLQQGLMSMVTVLVIACPCALGLATPTAVMVGIGKAAETGILIKDAESLETARRISAVVLDKTGTITEGKPKVETVFWLNDNEQYQPELTAIEQRSEHPLAAAVVSYLGQQNRPVNISSFESVTGKGAVAYTGEIKWLIGNRQLLSDHAVVTDTAAEQAAADFSGQGATVIYFARDKKTVAVLAITDKVKPGSVLAVSHLQNAGIEVYMLTGDQETAAAAIAKQAGIKHYKAGMLPHEKAAFIKDLQQQGKVVAMAGDGINDSNALAQSDVGIAMGSGSAIAMDVARMTIIASDLLKIPQAIRLSVYTVKAIRQNLFWAFIYNLIGIPLAAGVLFPLNGFLLDPMIAGAAMALSSVSVVSNSLRLKFRKLPA